MGALEGKTSNLAWGQSKLASQEVTLELGREGHAESAKCGSNGKTAFQVDRTVRAWEEEGPDSAGSNRECSVWLDARCRGGAPAPAGRPSPRLDENQETQAERQRTASLGSWDTWRPLASGSSHRKWGSEFPP